MFARHIDTERESSNGTTFQMPSLYLFDVSYITKYQYCPAASMRDSLIPPFATPIDADDPVASKKMTLDWSSLRQRWTTTSAADEAK